MPKWLFGHLVGFLCVGLLHMQGQSRGEGVGSGGLLGG